jgi:hypothetical protein
LINIYEPFADESDNACRFGSGLASFGAQCRKVGMPLSSQCVSLEDVD